LKACPHEDVPGETSPTGPRDERPTESPETEDPGQTPGGKRYEPC
jgi:hypothetical protein